MTAMMWSSSPTALGLPSSPLNPHTSQSSQLGSTSGPPAGSSSPVTSPTPSHSYSISHSPFILPPQPSFRHRSMSQPVILPRYPRPTSKRMSTGRPNGEKANRGHGVNDLFEGQGNSPVESAMWKERFTRRVKDRERRQRQRQNDMDRIRGIEKNSDEVEDEEAADKQAQADDEEIFRRLMVMQRRKIEHAHMVSYEIETGGSDPLLPDFWEEEEKPNHHRHQAYRDSSDMEEDEFDEDGDDQMMVTPKKKSQTFHGATPSHLSMLDEEEEWARQAAEAEQAEEVEIARRIEEAYGVSVPARSTGDELDMDWDAFDAMDIE